VNVVLGFVLICLGIAIGIFGDRKLNVKEGRILSFLSPNGPVGYAILLVGFGLSLILE
jgi:hypothetical protein